MLTPAHVTTIIAPTLARTVAAGFVTVAIQATGTSEAIVIQIHVMDEFCDMKLMICALDLGDDTYYLSLAAEVYSITGDCLFRAVVGDGRFNFAA